MVETQFKTKILLVRIDNGTEFINSPLLDFFASKGTLLHRTIVKTPQQNGVAERKHRRLLDTARAIGFHVGFLKSFWGECVLAATHIIIKIPMALLNWKSPFQLLHGTPPSYDYLRIVGVVALLLILVLETNLIPEQQNVFCWATLLVLKAMNCMICKPNKFFMLGMLFSMRLCFLLNKVQIPLASL